MKLTPTGIPGLVVIEAEELRDERGFFAQVFDTEAFANAGLVSAFPNHSIAHTTLRGTLRGLHFQRPPHAESKVVRCTAGAIFDVAVDLRKDSPAFGRWAGVRLDVSNMKALHIPAGCAHGYQTLTDETQIYYLLSAPHVRGVACGIHYLDPHVGVEWPLPVSCISQADTRWPSFDEAMADEP